MNNIGVGPQPLATGITYSPFGGVAGWTMADGASYSRSYDLDGRVASFALTIGSSTLSRSLTYDAAGRITAMVVFDNIPRSLEFLNAKMTNAPLSSWFANGSGALTAVAATNAARPLSQSNCARLSFPT